MKCLIEKAEKINEIWEKNIRIRSIVCLRTLKKKRNLVKKRKFGRDKYSTQLIHLNKIKKQT